MFNVGEFVLCVRGGVWKVIDVIGNEYHLQKHESEEMITVPVADSKEIVRKVTSKEQLLELIDRVGFITTIKAPNDKIRKEFYVDALNEFDEVEWVKVIKSVYLRQQDGRFMEGELEYADKAKSFLHGEISVVLGIPVREVDGYISSAVSDDKW
ncbi:hypothetical protein L323_08385 [Ruminiclostridium papyrosolvens C7]|uniref:CarD family transcriptional regulator n=1 Tax=Ruminiclostridium papyrosolvens C7 TaxID=1330534 RepID=U4R2C9_9FIRM|nr:hypothetical protein L323_08385 [Ruminiclostridium papyrosolvens C7]